MVACLVVFFSQNLKNEKKEAWLFEPKNPEHLFTLSIPGLKTHFKHSPSSMVQEKHIINLLFNEKKISKKNIENGGIGQ